MLKKGGHFTLFSCRTALDKISAGRGVSLISNLLDAPLPIFLDVWKPNPITTH